MSPGSARCSPRRREKVMSGARRAIAPRSAPSANADRDRGQCVPDVVALGERQDEPLLARRGRNLDVRGAGRQRGLQGHDITAGAEGENVHVLGEMGFERLRVHRHDRLPIGSDPAQDLRLGLGDRLERPEQFEVDGPDIGDNPDLRLGDLAELGDLTHAAHRHLEHQHLRLRWRAEDRQGQTDLGVVVLRARVSAERQQAPGDVLHRGLSGRAGDPDDTRVELPAPLAGERLERRQAGPGRR